MAGMPGGVTAPSGEPVQSGTPEDKGAIVTAGARATSEVSGRVLPLEVIYELGLSPALRLAAGGTELTDEQLNEIAAACWRAISQPE